MNTIMTETMKDLYIPTISRITATKQLTEKEKWFEIELPDKAPLNFQPGQFVEVSVFGFGEAPISICSSPTKKPRFELTIRKVGRLTNAIHNLDKDDKIGIRGPFGKGFDTDSMKGMDILFIAGGIGLAPLKSLIDYCIHYRDDFGRLIILYGAKSPAELLFDEDRRKWSERKDIEFHETVDRPSENWNGNTGVITTLIPPLTLEPSRCLTAIVGPPIMYKFVLLALKSKMIPDENIFMSLERRMKCGVGKCGHCQINHIYVCQEGPVFPYTKIKNLEEAL